MIAKSGSFSGSKIRVRSLPVLLVCSVQLKQLAGQKELRIHSGIWVDGINQKEREVLMMTFLPGNKRSTND